MHIGTAKLHLIDYVKRIPAQNVHQWYMFKSFFPLYTANHAKNDGFHVSLRCKYFSRAHAQNVISLIYWFCWLNCNRRHRMHCTASNYYSWSAQKMKQNKERTKKDMQKTNCEQKSMWNGNNNNKKLSIYFFSVLLCFWWLQRWHSLHHTHKKKQQPKQHTNPKRKKCNARSHHNSKWFFIWIRLKWLCTFLLFWCVALWLVCDRDEEQKSLTRAQYANRSVY